MRSAALFFAQRKDPKAPTFAPAVQKQYDHLKLILSDLDDSGTDAVDHLLRIAYSDEHESIAKVVNEFCEYMPWVGKTYQQTCVDEAQKLAKLCQEDLRENHESNSRTM